MPEKKTKEWQVEMVLQASKKFYRVFRFKDPEKEDKPENRETRGGLYDSYHDADRLRNVLNAEEAGK